MPESKAPFNVIEYDASIERPSRRELHKSAFSNEARYALASAVHKGSRSVTMDLRVMVIEYREHDVYVKPLLGYLPCGHYSYETLNELRKEASRR